ncbi:MAG: hypothetical protein AB7I38_08350 [Dehalococcoidia bacterium]
MRVIIAILTCAVALLAACSSGDSDTVVTEELAPIDEASIRIAESSPPQYFLDVTSGLPSGCAKFDRNEVARSGDTITVQIWNRIETPRDGACTAIYGMVEHSVPLGSDFEPGRTYTVRVNDVVRTFTAQ